MRDDRRRFLRVFGATAVGIALPACSSPAESGGSREISVGAGGDGGASGQGGAGGAGSTTTGSAGGAGGGGCVDPVGINAGSPSSFSAEGLHKGAIGSKFLIGRDANGIYAMSSICTHAFCNMNNTGLGVMNPEGPTSGAHCNCHGSNFAFDGSVIDGPAKSPLSHFAVALACDGTIRVDLNTIVPPATRLVVS